MPLLLFIAAAGEFDELPCEDQHGSDIHIRQVLVGFYHGKFGTGEYHEAAAVICEFLFYKSEAFPVTRSAALYTVIDLIAIMFRKQEKALFDIILQE